MKKWYLAFLCFVFFFMSCKKESIIEPVMNLSFSITDIAATEVWIKIKNDNVPLPLTIRFIQDNAVIEQVVNSNDTLIYCQGLRYNYNYKVYISGNNDKYTSPVKEFRTLNVTNNEFKFETSTFGEVGYSQLNDVIIINENDIWAVGEIYLKDSLGHYDPQIYNAVHWNGNKWEIKRIYHNNHTWITYSVFYINGDIWFGTYIKLRDGIFTQYNSDLTGEVRSLWGLNNSDLYAVGTYGNIHHFNGYAWSSIRSPLTLHYYDITGFIDPFSSKRNIYISGGSIENNINRLLTMDENNNLDSISIPNYGLSSIWSNSGNIFYLSGGYIFSNKEGKWNKEFSSTRGYTRKIRGNGLNDVFAAGEGTFSHYNGMGWKIFNDFNNYSFNSLSVKDNLVVMVGSIGEKAVITIGKR